jgi:hypothetical protein
MPDLVLGSLARPLLVLHALLGFTALGAGAHLAVVLWRARRAPELPPIARLYCRLLGGTFAASLGVGLLIYPSYRYTVRGLYLDRYEPWASSLFDIKENLAALALPLALALVVAARWREGRGAAQLVTFFALATLAVAAFAVVAGLVVTSVRGL